MKKILALHTGGTISMRENEQGEVLPSGMNPISNVSLPFSYDIELVNQEVFNLPSPHITPVEMLTLKELIKKAIASNEYQGIVITHGTDTLEETAFFLDNTLKLPIPVVLTGAMRSSNEIGSDGVYNFSSAIRVASDAKSIGKGVLVVMNDEIHTARYVTKTHTTNVATFRTPTLGPIGILTKHEVLFYHQLEEIDRYDIETVKARIPIVKAYAGMDEEIFAVLHKIGIDGVIIEALGAGNLPPNAAKGIEQLLQANIPVILVSRCFNGVAEPVYAYEGGGIQLEGKGVLFANSINSQKARLKLLIALNAKLTHSQLKKYFHDA